MKLATRCFALALMLAVAGGPARCRADANATDAAVAAPAPVVRSVAVEKAGDLIAATQPTEAKDPAGALAAYKSWLDAAPKVANAGMVSIYMRIVDLEYKTLHDVPAALQACQEGFDRAGGDQIAFPLEVAEMDILMAEHRPAEAEAIGARNAAKAARVGAWGSWQVVERYADALARQSKSDQAFDLIRETMLRCPPLLADEDGTFYDKLIVPLQRSGHLDDALAWAKLRFMLCRFQEADIKRATISISNTLAIKDHSARIVQEFVDAQTNSTKPNPLGAVALPVNADEVRQILADMPPYTMLDHNRITLMLAAGEYEQAMTLARRRVIDSNGSPDTVADVCRVFKAMDLNLKRANDFVDYMNGGKGANPVAEFLKQTPAATVTEQPAN